MILNNLKLGNLKGMNLLYVPELIVCKICIKSISTHMLLFTCHMHNVGGWGGGGGGGGRRQM